MGLRWLGIEVLADNLTVVDDALVLPFTPPPKTEGIRIVLHRDDFSGAAPEANGFVQFKDPFGVTATDWINITGADLLGLGPAADVLVMEIAPGLTPVAGKRVSALLANDMRIALGVTDSVTFSAAVEYFGG